MSGRAEKEEEEEPGGGQLLSERWQFNRVGLMGEKNEPMAHGGRSRAEEREEPIVCARVDGCGDVVCLSVCLSVTRVGGLAQPEPEPVRESQASARVAQ